MFDHLHRITQLENRLIEIYRTLCRRIGDLEDRVERMEKQKTNPVTLVQELDTESILKRLNEIDHERDALRVLMRAALRAKE